ncbi:L-2-hydroxyglutarate oxidase [Ochrobactrum sp. MYb15]|uniref:L-2-hydroxyglutarate oxidase n=1 Tax=Brucella pituitosa TaxID=571256 RepID=UPI000CFDA036|nr:L-2-hydroxyglutarate oxidase [Ochrobactrum sp. MYb19]PRA52656.1 L-2-hydroxyglutarate oxidase [Ochrobactrum sp. MYb68]PRA63439.1 L-2-hydroxyglutarate oxidase [Ochrobactrum sp. MYb18]PRA73671.1 L-2-hydroxyglutarate oxidase [Brucella thiophenivorans]PRA88434.1 L-2-hydroxyglutarate oxidase [Ochrobactrum sp. MYb14]PRA94728.1 L-2-hydroxyglutarate oxidase [Ochrobactrum sp. MYb15]
MFEYCIVGGGIVGLATALAITRSEPDARILLLEKELSLASHQTGHNSGVIHAGIYYQPGSLKAELCRAGERATKQFCDIHDIPYRTPGKLVVATNDIELQRLNGLEANAAANKINCRMINQSELIEMEPAVTGLKALLVEQSGIVDYRAVSSAMGELIKARGATIILGTDVSFVEERSDCIRVHTNKGVWESRYIVACAGLQSDRLAQRSGLEIDFQIVPFRGEYYALKPELNNLVERMIYPVPDPSMPFLGIHLTPMMDGSLTVGPNAVLGLSREGYAKFSASLNDIMSYTRFPGFWKVISQNLRSGIEEVKDSVFKSSYLDKCRKYCPTLQANDLLPYRAGIRAQAVSNSGHLIHDFKFLQTKRSLHVCNAPSPAATSAIPIGELIFKRLKTA